MFRNYCLTAWKVFLRRKFFTFINLFGIVLTLVVLIVSAAIADGVLSPKGPEKSSENYLVIDYVNAWSEDGQNHWSSGPGYHFLEHHVKPLQSPEKLSLYTNQFTVSAFRDGAKIEHKMRRTDNVYWDILEFEFVEGQAFNQQEFESGNFLAVISENFRDSYFGKDSVIGESFTTNGQRFTVKGVVRDVSVLEVEAASDVWVPYTTSPSTSYRESFMGDWRAMLYSSTQSGLQEIKEEYQNRIENNFKPQDPDKFARAVSFADNKLDFIARKFTNNSESFDSGVGQFLLLASGVIVLFMLLPSINLININISRMLERSTEIGLRKAFGASSKHLVGQFLTENILLTAIGGVFGFLGALGVLEFISQSGLLEHANFSINLNIFIWGLLMIVLFGIISGIYPAWKMSRMHPVSALKGEI